MDCSAESNLSSSWYMPGDHSLPHSDNSSNRSLAFIWHLTQQWRSNWGGGLYWCPAQSMVVPGFNVLHLFSVSNDSVHFVTTVAPIAQGKRLAINGWWRAKNFLPEPKPLSNSRSLDPRGEVISYFAPTRSSSPDGSKLKTAPPQKRRKKTKHGGTNF
jgi:hypothetical protein